MPLIRHLKICLLIDSAVRISPRLGQRARTRGASSILYQQLFFQDLNRVLELCPWKFLDAPLFFIPFFIKAMQTSLGRERFAQNYYDFCFDFQIAASCRLGIFPLIFVGTEPGTELGRISPQTQRIRSNILSHVVNVLAILQQGFHKMSCFSRGHLSPYVSALAHSYER